jgi:hypothetical protein
VIGSQLATWRRCNCCRQLIRIRSCRPLVALATSMSVSFKLKKSRLCICVLPTATGSISPLRGPSSKLQAQLRPSDCAPYRLISALSCRSRRPHQRLHVGERGERHDLGDDQRPRQRPGPIQTRTVLGHAPSLCQPDKKVHRKSVAWEGNTQGQVCHGPGAMQAADPHVGKAARS